MARTYEEWEDDARKKGLYDTFSERDIENIKQDVDYGDKMLDNKVAYGNASTDAQRAAIKNDTEQMRNSKGYYGSDDGTKAYGLEGTQANLDLIKKFESNNGLNKTKYSDTVDAMLMSMLSGRKFEYNAKSDPRYKLVQEYAEQAMKNQMAESASLTGGYDNSYAANIGQSVYNDYMENAVNNLEDRAYSRYNDEQSRRAQQLQYLMEADNREYNRAQTERQWDYQLGRDAISDARYDNEWDFKVGQTTKEEAQNMIASYIAAGQASAVPAEIMEAAGYTKDYVDTLDKAYKAQAAAKSSGGSGKTTTGSTPEYDAIKKKATSLDANEAKAYLEQMVSRYIDSDGAQGISPEEMEYIYEVELGGDRSIQKEKPKTPQELYSEAAELYPNAFTPNEFEKHKSNGVVKATINGTQYSFKDYASYINKITSIFG